MAKALKFSSIKVSSGELFLVIGHTSFIFDSNGVFSAVARKEERYCAGRETEGWTTCNIEDLQEYATKFLTEDTTQLLREMFDDQSEEGK
jgi:hypothetical protein